MSKETMEDLVTANAGDSEDEHGGTNSFALDAKPRILPSNLHMTANTGKQFLDSGYASVSSTQTQNNCIPVLSRRPGQIPFIRQLGLYISNKTMEAGTKRRFLEVQMEVEKILLEFMRKLTSAPGRHRPIAIRPMMLSKTDSDSDAKPYMVVICPENIKRKVQGFFDDSLIKSLCESEDDDDIPSFKSLVVGQALRLRASRSDIIVNCDYMSGFHNGGQTFCGMPIRLSDKFGSRNATFGGVIKLTSTDGEFHLYGLTAGHLTRDHQVPMGDEYTSPGISESSDPMEGFLGEEMLGAPEDQYSTESRTSSNNTDQDESDNWLFLNAECIGTVLDSEGQNALANAEQSQRRPCLDWALFELAEPRPNRLAVNGREQSGGDLHLPSPPKSTSKDEIFVSMLCASKGIKHGMLSTTRARVLLEPGDSFTDAYTLSLEDRNVSDGDSGSWVVDELRLEVHGHVVADDVFGDAYVIPMKDILADIQRCFGAESVDLPTGLDIISLATQQQPSLFSRPNPIDRSPNQSARERIENISQWSDSDKEALSIAKTLYGIGSSCPDFDYRPPPISGPISIPPRPTPLPLPYGVIHESIMMRPYTGLLKGNNVSIDSGYGSVATSRDTTQATNQERTSPAAID